MLAVVLVTRKSEDVIAVTTFRVGEIIHIIAMKNPNTKDYQKFFSMAEQEDHTRYCKAIECNGFDVDFWARTAPSVTGCLWTNILALVCVCLFASHTST